MISLIRFLLTLTFVAALCLAAIAENVAPPTPPPEQTVVVEPETDAVVDFADTTPEQVSELAARVGVAESRVVELRGYGMDWTELRMSLGMAAGIAAGHRIAIADAFTQVIDARGAGVGWWQIAKLNNLVLSDVVARMKGSDAADSAPTQTAVAEPEKK